MYKVLIVDDSAVDRENLRDILASQPFVSSLRIVGECENGAEALGLVEEHAPDLIISDIEMPVANGFDLAKNVRTRYPNVKIVFSSFYDEFEYAQKALYLGSYGYVLKPVDPADLRESIRKVTDTLSSEKERERMQEELRNQLETYRPQIVGGLLKDHLYGIGDSGDLHQRLTFLGVSLQQGCYRLSLLEIDDFPAIRAGRTAAEVHFLSHRVGRRLEDLLQDDSDAVLVKMDDSHFAVLHHFADSSPHPEISSRVDRLVGRLTESFAKTDLTLSAAVSDFTRNGAELHLLYEQCLYILRLKFTLGKGKVLYGKDVPASKPQIAYDFRGIEKDVRFLVHSSEAADIDPYLESLFTQADSLPAASEVKGLCVYILICLQNDRTAEAHSSDDSSESPAADWDRLLAAETAEEAKRIVARALKNANHRVRRQQNSQNKKIADEIRKYLEAQCQSSVNLETLSELFHYSPNYLNSLFKKETGITVYDYLTQCRMEKAKRLLADREKKLYEVAEAVGYSHTAYFSNLFKKYTGQSPKEFRGC
ncbi:response regulator transcription factor [Cohnella caldifontis]|uniref:response regulator transcription factor n=1 Tax=Cohnella caldifontis TaxID=3027471 RepID=UPI0023ECE89E|nr:response regulator [Cohnella sp. YIM B05605]